MVKSIRVNLWVCLLLFSMQTMAQTPTVQDLLSLSDKRIYVSSHRGDWRNHPENSLPALEGAISKGADIVEIDVAMTKDSVLIVMHDRSLDRTTNGKGPVVSHTYEEISYLRLRNSLGRVTHHKIPTLREFLLQAKGRILVNIDKGYVYLPQILDVLYDTGTIDEVIISLKSNTSLDKVREKIGVLPPELVLMPVLSFEDKQAALATMDSYVTHQRTIFQPVWSDDSQMEGVDFHFVRNQGFGIWFNSLWDSLCGGHDDDRAVEENEPTDTWGWLIEKGATIIQTDRLSELKKYLSERELTY